MCVETRSALNVPAPRLHCDEQDQCQNGVLPAEHATARASTPRWAPYCCDLTSSVSVMQTAMFGRRASLPPKVPVPGIIPVRSLERRRRIVLFRSFGGYERPAVWHKTCESKCVGKRATPVTIEGPNSRSRVLNEGTGRMNATKLLAPFAIRGVSARNRIVVAPMCQYSAHDGMANDFHLVHLGQFATGGAGIVMTEATAVTAQGRISHNDLGLYEDAQVEPLRRIARFLKAHGAVPAMQLAHAGRKASARIGWLGGEALDESDAAAGRAPWEMIGPSPLAQKGWNIPLEMTKAMIEETIRSWADAARRAVDAGFEILEIHGAHGYLIHQFLSPASNTRTDEYGGAFSARIRFACEVAEAVRAAIPETMPLFFRISSVDGQDGEWTLDDSVALARALKSVGVDVIDCSSGGMLSASPSRMLPRTYGYQIPYAARIRREAHILTMAVGLIVHPLQAEEALQNGEADLIGLGRELLHIPNWPLHAARLFSGSYDSWPDVYGYWLGKRETVLKTLPSPHGWPKYP